MVAWLAVVIFFACVGVIEAQTTEVASDDFNRPDGPLGTNWAYPSASETTFVITNDTVTPADSDHHTEALWTSNNFSNDQYSQIYLSTIGPWTGVVLRADTNQDEFYMGFVFAPNDYRIYLRYGDTNTYQYFSLATGSAVTWQTGDTMRLEVSGSNDPVTITMYRNDAPVLVWRSIVNADPFPVKNGGNPGIGIYSRTGDNLTLGDWQGGNLNPDTNPPSDPTNLVATVASYSEIDLSWAASTDDVGVVGYVIERSVGAGSTNFTQIGIPLGTDFNDTQAAPGATNNYEVMALDAAGNLSGSNEVTVTLPIPAPPAISVIPDQTTLTGIAVGPFPFYISDDGIDPYSLSVTASSSNQNLVPNQNLSLSNLGSTQALTMVPTDGQSGTSVITITVSNGETSTNTSFLLTANPPGNGTDVFANDSNIVISSLSAASPYPSSINISGEAGTITNLTVTLHGMSHNAPNNVNALLVGPGGEAVVLMSDTIDGYPMTDLTFTLADQAWYPLPVSAPLANGTFQPTDDAPNHTDPSYAFPSPAPAPPFAGDLTAFNGLSPNGIWSLYISDGGSGDTGQIAGGWSLAITTVSPPIISGLTDQSTPVNTATAAIPFEIEDAQTPASNLVLTATSSNPALVNANTDIVFGGSDTNSTITVTPEPNTIGTSTISVIVTDSDGMSATNSFLMTVNPGQLTVTGITAADKVYDGTTAATLNVSEAILIGQGLNGSDVTLDASGATGIFADQNVATNKTVQIAGLMLNGSDAGNYILIQPATIASITPATLTASAVNDNRTYGLPNPPLTVSYTGFVNGEGTNVLTGAPGLSTSAIASSPPGSYPITVTTGTLYATNYTFNFVNGTLTVIAQPELTAVILNGSQLVSTWPTITGQTYQLQATTNLNAPVWTESGVTIAGTGNPVTVTNTIGASPQFFRVSIGQ
ncbi:MAG TPA: YDG domain-containing protein [Candidatus Acidoferrales bacterium]|nr:YDG domain-containing protein [Candidatus Acidoferrales bacterium]